MNKSELLIFLHFVISNIAVHRSRKYDNTPQVFNKLYLLLHCFEQVVKKKCKNHLCRFTNIQGGKLCTVTIRKHINKNSIGGIPSEDEGDWGKFYKTLFRLIVIQFSIVIYLCMRTTYLDCLLIIFLYPFVENFFLLRIIMSAKLTKRRKMETFYTRSHYLKTKLGPQDPSKPNPKNTKRKSVYRREANVMKVWIWSLLQGNILKCG